MNDEQRGVAERPIHSREETINRTPAIHVAARTP